MGVSHTRTHALQLGCNIIYGHTHDSQKSMVQHIDGGHMAFSLGCLCDMSKDFLKGRPTNWSHNVGVVDIFTNGTFNLVVLEITNGITSYCGEIISA